MLSASTPVPRTRPCTCWTCSAARSVSSSTLHGTVRAGLPSWAAPSPLTGQTCRLDADCPSGQGCQPDLGQCYRGGDRLRLGNPAADPREGDTYFDLGAYEFSADGISGGGWLVEMAGPGAAVRHLGADAGCALVTNPSPSPVAGILLAIHSMCRDARDEGIHAWDTATGQHQLVVPTSSGGLEVALETPDWLADGSGFLFVARDQVVTESGAWFGAGVHAYDIATAGLVRVIPPPAPDIDIRSGAPANDGQAAVVCYVTASGTELWLLELPYTGQGTRLVSDERSCSPSW